MGTAMRGALLCAAAAVVTVTACDALNSVGAPMGFVGIVVDSSAMNRTAAPGTVIPVGVTVYDNFGGFDRGATVNWKVIAGGGSVSDTSTQGDANGHATVLWTLGPTPGGDTLMVGSPGLVSIRLAAVATTDTSKH